MLGHRQRGHVVTVERQREHHTQVVRTEPAYRALRTKDGNAMGVFE